VRAWAFVIGAGLLAAAATWSTGLPPFHEPRPAAAPAEPRPGEPPPPSAAAVADAVSRGLKYLALSQRGTGAWLGDVGHKQMDRYVVYFERERQEAEDRGNVGVTALAGLAFLAGGHLPGRGPHGKLLERTIGYMLNACSGHNGPEGYIADSQTRMYEHAFATLFLSQVYGMTGAKSAGVARRLKGAVDLIVDCQTDTGGWRYGPYTNECDLSVTVCQVQALRAARDAGIPVKRSCIDRVVEYIKASQIPYGPERGLFWYKITGTSAKTKTSFAINAAAVTALHSSGIYTDEDYGAAVRYLESEYADVSRHQGTHFYYWYGNYYAAQAFRQCGGERWERYWKRLARDLLSRQQSDGRWVNDVGPGDEFATAMACLILQIPDAFLPIFQR
jgi:hypothetical protein